MSILLQLLLTLKRRETEARLSKYGLRADYGNLDKKATGQNEVEKSDQGSCPDVVAIIILQVC